MGSIRVGVGFHNALSPAEAATKAAIRAKNALGDNPITLTLVFSTPHYEKSDILTPIHENLTTSNLLGLTAGGFMLDEGPQDRGVCVICLHSNRLLIKPGQVSHINLQSSISVGRALAKTAETEFNVRNALLYLFMIDGSCNDVTSFIGGLRETLRGDIDFIGVQASDNFSYRATSIFYQQKRYHHAAAGALISGDLKIGCSIGHGCRALGKPRLVTESKGHIILKIDDQPAAKFFEEFFQAEAEALKSGHVSQIHLRYPLGLRVAEGRYLLRHVIRTESNGSIVCQDQVPERMEVHPMISNVETCLQSATMVAAEAKSKLNDDQASLLLMFESTARHRLLGRAARQEWGVIREYFGKNIPAIGILCAGEALTTKLSKEKIFTPQQNHNLMLLAMT